MEIYGYIGGDFGIYIRDLGGGDFRGVFWVVGMSILYLRWVSELF